MEFRILGPIEVRDGDRVLALGGPRHRALLALLLLHANEVVPTDRLIDALYGETPPRTAGASLQNSLSHLRKLLGADVLRTQPPGYLLAVDADALDLTRFQRLVAEARDAGPTMRASTLRAALELWHGSPLADVAYEPFAQGEIARLEELRLEALEDRIDADLELGRHRKIVAELEAFAARHPLRERLRGQLMLALYRSGRQAEALEAYQAARTTLVEQLGLEPSPELQRLEQAILRQDTSLELEQAAPRPVAAPTAQRRKTATVLFSDLVESTALGDQLDAEVLHDALSRYFEEMRTVLERHGGTVEKFIGDAVVAVFGVPLAHEDDALRAIRAAVEMREALDTLNEHFEAEFGIRLRARTGINTGEVFAPGGPTSAFRAGDPGNVAARLQESARAGEIVIGEATYRLVRDAVTAELLGPLEVKGKRAPIESHRLLDVEAATPGRKRRFDTPMVGRDRELDALRDAFEAALEGRTARLCTILGAAGVGKSRLVREFESRLGGQARFLHGRCLPYGEGISFWPLIEAVKQAADVTEDTAADEARARTEALVAGEDGERLIAARLSQLLGVGEGTASSEELAWAVRRLFEALARRRPLVLVFDDIHWAEPVFLDLVELVARSSARVPIVVVCLARPDLLETRPDWGADGTGVRLTPLGPEESEQLVENLLGGAVDANVSGRIRAAAEGNPLYVEEFVAMLIDDGFLQREDGHWVPAADLAALEIPPTLSALLAARLDRLPDGQRRALEVASIEGQVFHAGGVTELVDEKERPSVTEAIRGLVHRDLVRPARSSFADDEAFRFRHLLIRDAAYAALPKRHRANLHERFAGWVDERSADRLAERDAIVGYHLEQAYRYGAELGRADTRLGRSAGGRLATAGLAAARRGDDTGVLSLLARATSLIPADVSAGLDLLCELGLALRRVGRVAEADQVFDDAVRAAAGDVRSELRARIEQACAALFGDALGRADEVLELADRAIPLLAEAGDDRSLARAWSAVGFVHAFRGDNAAWEAAQEEAWRHLLRAGWSPSAAGDIAAAAFQGPRPVREVVTRCNELLDETVGQPRAEATILCFLAGLEAMLGRFDEARMNLARARSLYQELGDRLHLARGYAGLKGQVEVLAGDLDAAEQAWREGCEILAELGDSSFLASHMAELADVLYAQDRLSEADEYSQLSEDRAAPDDVYTQILWRIPRSKVLARHGKISAADALAREAVELGSKTDALVVTGRAHVALAEVLSIDRRLRPAMAAARTALQLFTRKGDSVSARRTRAFIRRLESEAAQMTELAGT